MQDPVRVRSVRNMIDAINGLRLFDYRRSSGPYVLDSFERVGECSALSRQPQGETADTIRRNLREQR